VRAVRAGVADVFDQLHRRIAGIAEQVAVERGADDRIVPVGLGRSRQRGTGRACSRR
jgi:hypothetical protein